MCTQTPFAFQYCKQPIGRRYTPDTMILLGGWEAKSSERRLGPPAQLFVSWIWAKGCGGIYAWHSPAGSLFSRRLLDTFPLTSSRHPCKHFLDDWRRSESFETYCRREAGLDDTWNEILIERRRGGTFFARDQTVFLQSNLEHCALCRELCLSVAPFKAHSHV